MILWYGLSSDAVCKGVSGMSFSAFWQILAIFPENKKHKKIIQNGQKIGKQEIEILSIPAKYALKMNLKS